MYPLFYYLRGDFMKWLPKISRKLFHNLNGIFVNKFTGESVTNPLVAQMQSYVFERVGTMSKSDLTEKDIHNMELITGTEYNPTLDFFESPEEKRDRILEEVRQQSKTQFLESDYSTGVEYKDYIPTIKSTGEGAVYEQIYNNFMMGILNQTNETVFDIFKKALDTTGRTKQELGYAISQLDEDIIHFIGYEGVPSSQFGTEFVNRLGDIFYELDLDKDARQEIEDAVQEYQMGE